MNSNRSRTIVCGDVRLFRGGIKTYYILKEGVRLKKWASGGAGLAEGQIREYPNKPNCAPMAGILSLRNIHLGNVKQEGLQKLLSE